MKKAISLFLCLVILACVLPVPAAKAVKISELTFDQLIELRRKINLELISRPDYQEVTVPQGVYRVGEDIPAGTWTIKCAVSEKDKTAARRCHIEWGDYLSESGQDIDWIKGDYDSVSVYNPNHKYYEDEPTQWTITLKTGQYVVIDNSASAAVFCTYTRKPDLGFR